MILVTGATGTIGSHLVPSLLAQGAQVRVLMRDPDKARAAFGDRVDIVSGDLLDTSSVRVALKGVDSVFLNSPSLEGFVHMVSGRQFADRPTTVFGPLARRTHC